MSSSDFEQILKNLIENDETEQFYSITSEIIGKNRENFSSLAQYLNEIFKLIIEDIDESNSEKKLSFICLFFEILISENIDFSNYLQNIFVIIEENGINSDENVKRLINISNNATINKKDLFNYLIQFSRNKTEYLYMLYSLDGFKEIIVETISYNWELIEELLDNQEIKSNIYNLINVLKCLEILIEISGTEFKEYASSALYKTLDYLSEIDVELQKRGLLIIINLTKHCNEQLEPLKEKIIEFLKYLKNNSNNSENINLCNILLEHFYGENKENEGNINNNNNDVNSNKEIINENTNNNNDIINGDNKIKDIIINESNNKNNEIINENIGFNNINEQNYIGDKNIESIKIKEENNEYNANNNNDIYKYNDYKKENEKKEYINENIEKEENKEYDAQKEVNEDNDKKELDNNNKEENSDNNEIINNYDDYNNEDEEEDNNKNKEKENNNENNEEENNNENNEEGSSNEHNEEGNNNEFNEEESNNEYNKEESNNEYNKEENNSEKEEEVINDDKYNHLKNLIKKEDKYKMKLKSSMNKNKKFNLNEIIMKIKDLSDKQIIILETIEQYKRDTKRIINQKKSKIQLLEEKVEELKEEIRIEKNKKRNRISKNNNQIKRKKMNNNNFDNDIDNNYNDYHY